MPILSARQHLGIAKETTWGTGVAPTLYLPYDGFGFEPVQNSVVDEARRGNLTKDYNVIFTTKSATADFESMFYPGTIPLFIYTLLGKATTTGVNPYVHTFQVDPTARSLTLQHFNGSQERQFAGCVVDEVSIKGDAEGALTFSAKLQGKFPTNVATTTPTISTSLSPLVGAQASLTIATVANTNLFGWEINLKRANKLIFGANTTQDATKVAQSTIEATFKLTFDVENQTEYALFTAQAATSFVLTFGGTASNSAKVTFSDARIEKATEDDGNENLRVDIEGRGVYNTTDAGPCSVTVTNTVVSY